MTDQVVAERRFNWVCRPGGAVRVVARVPRDNRDNPRRGDHGSYPRPETGYLLVEIDIGPDTGKTEYAPLYELD